ncbi:MAG: methylmalonyl-CoA mutase family protein [Chloroflexota bacterium]
MGEDTEQVKKKRQEWEEKVLKPTLKTLSLNEPPTKFYTPADAKGFDFLTKVGFPGQYPYTAGTYAVRPPEPAPRTGVAETAFVRASGYSGYGTAEDTRDYYKQLQKRGGRQGPNLAFDLPTQCGYDSDNPLVRGDVGKVGVAVSTFKDFETIYEAFVGDLELDRIASNFTINAPANIIIAMYLALAEKRGIAWEKLRSTPQNDILKEFVARGTYIFPPKPSMRMFRDSLTFLTKHCPNINLTSGGGYHIRNAGCTREQDLGFSMAIMCAYLQEGINAGLDIDSLAPKFTFNAFGGSMEFFKEIAFWRAARRMWAKIVREKFGSKNPRSWLLRCRGGGASAGNVSTTAQRPLNNIARGVIGGVANCLSGGNGGAGVPYDEPLGLGWSLEAIQIQTDAGRIIRHEARLLDVEDPLAGSYFVESLTDEVEAAGWKEMEKIEAMGGAVAAVENGYMYREVARSAHEQQRRMETGEQLVVGVNCFLGEDELEVETTRLVPHPYDPLKRERAEEKQIRDLTEFKKSRDSRLIASLLKELKEKARKEDENLIPHLVECAKAYASVQDMCDALREVFGEYQPVSL